MDREGDLMGSHKVGTAIATGLATSSGSSFRSLKFKISLLGPFDHYNRIILNHTCQFMLPTTEQSSIGVTISGDSLMKIYPNENFQETKIYFNYTLWNISCKRDYRDLRPLYYKASEGIIIPLTYDTISQLPDYFFEIQDRSAYITIIFLFMCPSNQITPILEMMDDFFSEQKIAYEWRQIMSPKECIDIVADKFYEKSISKVKRDYYCLDFIDPALLGIDDSLFLLSD